MIDGARNTPLPKEAPVLIVGGGAVGLSLALMLGRLGQAPLLIGRHPGTSIHPRARGINVRTMEIFRLMGLEAPIRETGAALAKNKCMLWVESLAGTELRRVPLDQDGAGAE